MEEVINTRVSICRSNNSPFRRGLNSVLLAISTRNANKALLLVICTLLVGCDAGQTSSYTGPAVIEFTSVPVAGAGDSEKLSTIKGRVIGARPGQQIVLYAKGETAWWVQPFVDQPFTTIRPNSKWRNVTHPGTEYAALLVGPGFRPPPISEQLPTEGVVSFAVTHGELPYRQRWWFPFVCILGGVLAIFGLHRLRIHQMTQKLNLRFEERLAERMLVAQELHDTLLQGVLSASMQLHVAVDQLPADSPAQPALSRVLELMAQVVEEGRNTVRGLRSTIDNAHDLEHSFSRIPQELSIQKDIGFRVIVEGPALPLLSAIRNEVYSIGREALVNAFRHSRASNIEVELEYAAKELRVLVRDNGCGIDPKVLQLGREGHWGLSGMRERAERIGAKFKILSSPMNGTEVDLRVPSRLAFEPHPSNPAFKWFTRLYMRAPKTAEVKRGRENGKVNKVSK
jgi:signal transduction histidine kinase